MLPDLYFIIPGNLHTLTGGYAYDRELIAGLQSLGIRVHHITVSARYPLPDAEAEAETARLIAAIPDNAVILADGLAYGAMDNIARIEHQRLKIIALCHHPLAFESGLDTRLQSHLFKSEKAALELARAVVVTSPATARLLSNAFGVAENKITVALPGTQKQAFAPCMGHPPVLLTVATLIQRKAHDVLIDALSRLTYLDWSARFVGGDQFDPEWAAFLKKRTETLGLAERISFVGNVSDLNPEYANADVFVLPSRFEGYGMVFAEALAAGLPIVAARAGAVPDVVPETAGMLIPPDDATRLAFALHTMLTEPQQYQALRLGAQQAAASLPDWQQSAAQVADLLQTINATGQDT
ncbi:MAG: glycosyltransferase family 4 protein [Pseudohongiella sp.]|nr:glycosyltransferase family 4 protein [Pseudohongiella sp.]MDP2127073.1 glycosyltransferase family 4 protein [Pseudohongiella sp.]